MDQENSSWLTTRIENPKMIAVLCLGAYCHSVEIDQVDALKFNKFSEYIDGLAVRSHKQFGG
jgi:hypothetical protein